ncbi:MAG: histidine triad nucleotide-binding protein [Planctomycetota bacterium]
MPENVFTKILKGEIPADIVYEDEHAIAFKDVAPQAPVHLLVIPRKPLESLHAAAWEDAHMVGHLLRVCSKVAGDAGLAEGGYRVVTNVGADGGQTVEHLHFHVLGGRALAWPPG